MTKSTKHIPAIALILTFILTACQSGPSERASEIISKSVSALNKLNAFRLDTTFANDYHVYYAQEETSQNAAPAPTTWNGTRVVDVSKRQMQMKMNILIADGIVASSNDEYIAGGWVYTDQIVPRVGGVTPWTKTKLTDQLWLERTQMPEIIKLLQTATSPVLVAGDNASDPNHYVIDAVTSSEAVVDWVLSQDERNYSMLTSRSYKPGVLVGRDIFTKTYQGGTIRVWVDKRTYLVVKAEVNATFEGTSEDIGIYAPSGEGISPDRVVSKFAGQANFYDYNNPVHVQLPQEVSNAREY